MAFLSKEKELAYRRSWYKQNAAKLRPSSKHTQRHRRGYPLPTRAESTACEICHEHFTKTPLLDHCHETGVFRGWLCRTCNSGLGQFKDNVVILEKAAEYLRKTKGVATATLK